MQAIWKYPLFCTDKQKIALPKNCKILCIQIQRNSPCLWVINPDIENNEREEHTFVTYGTGHQHKFIEGTYIGTYQLGDGGLIFHVFEE